MKKALKVVFGFLLLISFSYIYASDNTETPYKDKLDTFINSIKVKGENLNNDKTYLSLIEGINSKLTILSTKYKNNNKLSKVVSYLNHKFWVLEQEISYRDKILGVDKKTFVFLGRAGGLGDMPEVFKDKNKVYIPEWSNLSPEFSKKLDNVDASSFDVFGKDNSPFWSWSCYFKDKNYVYNTSLEKIDNIDINSVELVGNSCYLKDENFVHFGKDIIFGADSKSIELVDDKGIYIKDKKGVYDYNGLISGADPKTFGFFMSWYPHNESEGGGEIYKDKNFVYINGNIVPGADLKTFEVLTKLYKDEYGNSFLDNSNNLVSKDKNNVYYTAFYGTLTLGLNPKLAEVIKIGEDDYVKDDKKVYKNGELTDLDPKSIVLEKK